MRNVYPQAFKEMWKAPDVKIACISTINKTKVSDCENCGGLGVMYTFIGKAGPFDTPGNLGQVSKFAEGKWWVGENYGAQCPVCRGTGRDPNYVEQPVVKRDCRVADVVKAVER